MSPKTSHHGRTGIFCSFTNHSNKQCGCSIRNAGEDFGWLGARGGAWTQQPMGPPGSKISMNGRVRSVRYGQVRFIRNWSSHMVNLVQGVPVLPIAACSYEKLKNADSLVGSRQMDSGEWAQRITKWTTMPVRIYRSYHGAATHATKHTECIASLS